MITFQRMLQDRHEEYRARPRLQTPAPTHPQALPELVNWSTRDYHAMADAGLSPAGVATELVEGQILQRSPIGALHFGFQVHLLNWMYDHLDREAYQPIGQSPLALDEHNEPQPDLYVVPKRGDGYVTALPRAAEARLVVEIADSSIA